jgi:hypothetical protein
LINEILEAAAMLLRSAVKRITVAELLSGLFDMRNTFVIGHVGLQT